MCCSSSLQRLTLAQCAAPDSERATLQRLQRLTLSPEVGGTRVESLETCLMPTSYMPATLRLTPRGIPDLHRYENAVLFYEMDGESIMFFTIGIAFTNESEDS